MRKINFIVAILALGGALTGCDFIDGPKVDETAFPSSGNKVLLEDFTGHQCGNCPRAHEKAAELMGIYGENLIVVAVHAGGFAEVDVNDGYATDFNTPMGTELEQYYEADLEGLPIGLVNRRLWNGQRLAKYANWSSYISQVLAEDPKLTIEVETNYDNLSRNLDITANLEYFSAGDANHHIVAVLTEDSIVAQQADYSLPSPSHIEDYVQMHVLRESITPGTWGIPVKGNTIFAGEKLTHTFSLALDSGYVARHCEVVVYVMDNTTKEIIQAEKAAVEPQ